MSDEKSFSLQMQANGINLPTTIKLKLVEWDEQGIVAAELKSKVMVRIQWPESKIG